MKSRLAMVSDKILGLIAQSIISLTSSLEVKMIIALVKTISISQVFLLKMWVAFANAKATHIFFQQKILASMPYWMIKVLTKR